MYIIPRLFGISIYLLVTLIAVFWLAKVQARQTKYVLLAYLLQLSIIGYFYYPDQFSDLFRVRIYVHTCADTSWRALFDSIISRTSGLSSTPAAMVYYKIVGSFDNDGFIPFFTCLIVFGIIFYCLYDFKNDIIYQIEYSHLPFF